MQTYTYWNHEKTNFFSVIPEKGGMISAACWYGKHALFMNPVSLEENSKSIRGGIPILFPNAGPLRENDIYQLPQHGCVRKMSWQIIEKTVSECILEVESTRATQEIYPYTWKLRARYFWKSEDTLGIELCVKNTGGETLPIAPGIHPYFPISGTQKGDISFGDESIHKAYIQNMKSWLDGDYFCVDIPTNKTISWYTPDSGTYTMTIPEEFTQVWIWSDPKSESICVEPVYGEVDALIDSPYSIHADSEVTFLLTLSFQGSK